MDERAIAVSRSNAERLEVLTGEVREIKHDLKGLVERFSNMEVLMFGKNKPQEGIVFKVWAMWRVHLFFVALLGGGVTLGVEHAIQWLFKTDQPPRVHSALPGQLHSAKNSPATVTTTATAKDGPSLAY